MMPRSFGSQSIGQINRHTQWTFQCAQHSVAPRQLQGYVTAWLNQQPERSHRLRTRAAECRGQDFGYAVSHRKNRVTGQSIEIGHYEIRSRAVCVARYEITERQRIGTAHRIHTSHMQLLPGAAV
jgi:hypothetical protein